MTTVTIDPARRQLWDVELAPVIGSTIQPTAFPDIGAAQFRRPQRGANGQLPPKEALLVESVQSMANHLEATGWNRGTNDQVGVFDGLPYVRVLSSDEEFVTSSRLEAHRLASAFVRESDLGGRSTRDVIGERLGLQDSRTGKVRRDRPTDFQQVAHGVMSMDPLCLVHGVFFTATGAASFWPGQPKIARALAGVIEAVGVEPVHSGGVKHDDVRHSVNERTEGGTKEGYGTVPFHRTEYTAERIAVSFSLDRQQIASYGLGSAGVRLLETIARWEVRALLDHGLRLRTACDLAPVSNEVTDQAGEPLADLEKLSGELREAISASKDVLGDGKPIDVVWSG